MSDPEQTSPPRNKVKNKPLKIGCGCISVFFVLVVLIAIFAPEEPTPKKSPSSVGAQAKPAKPPTDPNDVGLGGIGYVRCGSDPAILLAFDKTGHEALVKSFLADDTQGIAELLLAGSLFSVNRGTKVKLIDQDWSRRRVRIMEGDMAGNAGWISTQFVFATKEAAK